MAKENSKTIRIHPKFKEMINGVLDKKHRSVKTPRLTLAMYRQYKKNPNLLKELIDTDLK